jgi:5-formyltetrahydrofolate cyclo-ligase
MMRMKARLRRRLLSQRAALTELEIERKSAAIADQVCTMAAFCASHTIMVYLARAQEVQTARIIETARRQGKRIAVPVVDGPLLVAVELPLEAAQLRRGPYGILEPCRTAPVIQPEEIQYIAVPGVAFDRQGGRLGFGKGYYDRFLGRLPTTAYYCGLAFCMQLVPYVPRMPHDVCMHGIVTERGFIPCDNNTTHQLDNRLAREWCKGEFR